MNWRMVPCVVAMAAALTALTVFGQGSCAGTPSPAAAKPIPCAAKGLENGSFKAELNGFQIHYEVRGKGPVLMTLPNSWGLTLDGLRGLYRPLEERYTLIYFDPRGMGESGPVKQDSDRSLAAVREDFDALRRHLRIAKANAIGWSNGAINLILLASEKPDTLASAIFLHGTARISEEDDRQMAKDHAEAYRRYEKFFAEMGKKVPPPKDADERLKRFYLDQAFPDLCADPASTGPKIREAFKEAQFGWLHTRYSTNELTTFDFRDRLAKITARCLVIAGAHDLLPPARVREIALAIPGASYRLFEKSGHFAPLEEPGAFQAALAEFFSLENNWQTQVLDLERWALDRWGEGDPSGFLSICDPAVTYFDPTLAKRLDGIEALGQYYEPARGKIRTDRWEMLNPKVELFWDSAVLSYNLVTGAGGKEFRWNCTEVYHRNPSGWRIIHSHWSQTQAIKP
jgi:pimeloyl-ACP methyl ester carboxylesterase